jgi:hypothetical protein
MSFALLIGVVSEIADLNSSDQCLVQRLPIPAQLISPEPARSRLGISCISGALFGDDPICPLHQ